MKKTVRAFILCLMAAVLACCPALSGAEEAEPVWVDLDLSILSGTVVYAQVYNMMYDPDQYLGKIIRIAGYYNYFDDQAHGVVYHACVVPDATACCAQGIEFVRAGEHAWPEDYPQIGDEILVTGRLEMYEDQGTKYLHLVDAEMLLQESGDSGATP